MKKTLLCIGLFITIFINAQDHYEGKFGLGSNPANWYKLASFDFTGNNPHNSVNVNAEVNFIRTGERGYNAKIQLHMRESSGVITARWNYTITGTEVGDYIAFKKVSATTYELFAKSPGMYGHLSVEMTITKESTLLVTIPSVTTLIPDPTIYEDVTKSGSYSFISGNVGIGTTTPDAKLAVNGNIHTKEVKVDLIGWPDFVFEDSYTLPTLQEVETHIKEKGHLQDIPSAEEVAKNGIFLGEMDAKLLQKIEELTLYTIQQEKRIEQLEATNKKLLETMKKITNISYEE
ncbi:hypothetical protein [Leptobacterium sp. I13]|uniref:hypothetical protein n=1 Tax=Leptobacterium meishanense TaxID=3128904 RepID=UPI0030EC51CE